MALLKATVLVIFVVDFVVNIVDIVVVGINIFVVAQLVNLDN